MIFNKKRFASLLLIFSLMSIWPFLHNTPILHIRVVSSIQDSSQLFYKKTHLGFSEAYSTKKPLSIGEQTLSFKLIKMSHSLRWDPANSSGTFLIKGIDIEICKVSFSLDLNRLSSGNQISSLALTPKGLLITTTAKANDPQIQFSIPLGAINAIKYISTAIMLIFIVLFFFSAAKSRLFSIGPFSIKSKEFLLLDLKKLEDKYYFSLGRFAILVAITCCFYWYFLSHFYLLIDDEYSAFRAISPDSGNVWIGQGRWLSYFLDKYILAQPIVPYVQNFIFCCCIALSYMFILSVYKLKDRAIIYFTYPLFCAFPVWAFIMAFYANIAAVSVGILLVSIAILIFDSYKDSLSQMRATQKNLVILSVQVILVAMATATYQVFILVYVAMGLGLILFNLATTQKNEIALRKPMLDLLYFAVITVLGLLSYFLIDKLMLWLIPSDTAYLKGMLDWQRLFKTPITVILTVSSEAWAYYSGSVEKYGATLSFTLILLISSILIYFVPLWKKKSKKIFSFHVSLWIILLFIPFAFNFISTGSVMATRSLLAIPFVMWFMAIIALTGAKAIAKTGVFVVLLILEFQILQATGLYAAAIEITGNHDRALAANLYERVGALSTDGCNDKPCVVDVYGQYHINTPYPTAWGSTMGASFFEWDDGNIYRMFSFMRLLGYTNFVALGDPQYRTNNITLFEKMPVWPAAGSVIKSKDVYLVKLSNIPDPAHVKK